MERGKMIVIEGTDASGKETQTDLLLMRLRAENIQCEKISFPRYERPTGRIIGECYLGKKLKPADTGLSWFGAPAEVNALDPLVASCYYAADRKEATPYILKTLNSGLHLISNRYVESNKGHQGGKERDPEKRKELFSKIGQLEHEVLQIPRADAVIFLYMPWQIAKKLKENRGGHLDAHESNEGHLRNAEEAYLQLAGLENWLKIDCSADKINPRLIEDIAEEVYQKFILELKRGIKR